MALTAVFRAVSLNYTKEWDSMQSEFSALETLLREYENTILKEDFRIRIRDRELKKLFPFSIHNIYRVLLSIAGTFYAGFEEAIRCSDPEYFRANLGLPNRVFRYSHVILMGACDELTRDKLTTLNRIATHALARINSTLVFSVEEMPNEVLISEQFEEMKRKIIILAVYLREFVDLIHMGQHDQGFISYPPAKTEADIVVLRRYFNLPTEVTLCKEIDIYTLYRPESGKELHYDRFRGDIERLPAPSYLKAAGAIRKESATLLDSSAITRIISSIKRRLVFEKDLLDKTATIDAEKKLANMFCTELFTLLSLGGQDIISWQERINHDLEKHYSSQPESLSDAPRCYTDDYVFRLRESVNMIRKAIVDEETILP